MTNEWMDMKLYWAWRGEKAPTSYPPTQKRLLYATIGETHSQCCGVFDDEKYTPLYEDEFAWWESKGFKVIYPEEHMKETKP